jgi:hypothetical protein
MNNKAVLTGSLFLLIGLNKKIISMIAQLENSISPGFFKFAPHSKELPVLQTAYLQPG